MRIAFENPAAFWESLALASRRILYVGVCGVNRISINPNINLDVAKPRIAKARKAALGSLRGDI